MSFVNRSSSLIGISKSLNNKTVHISLILYIEQYQIDKNPYVFYYSIII